MPAALLPVQLLVNMLGKAAEDEDSSVQVPAHGRHGRVQASAIIGSDQVIKGVWRVNK